MGSFKALIVFTALLPAAVRPSPLPEPNAALGISSGTLGARADLIGPVDVNYKKRGLPSSHLDTTKSTSTISVSADIAVKLKGLISQLLSLISGSTELPSSYQGLCNAANQLVGATDGSHVMEAIEALQNQVNTLLKTASGDLKTQLQAISGQLDAIRGTLPGQVASVNVALNAAIGGTVGGLLNSLGLNIGTITLPSTPSVSVALPSVAVPSIAVPSVAIPSVSIPSVAIPSASGTVTIDINANIRSIVSRLLSLANGSITLPNGVSLQNLLNAANQLVTATSATAVTDALGSLSTAINNLLSSSTTITGSLLTQLQELSKSIDEVKANLVGQAIADLNSKLAASGGTITGLLSGLGLNVDASLFTSGSVAVENPVTGANTVDITADLQTAVQNLLSIANYPSVPPAVSLQNLLNAAGKLITANSASAVASAVSAVATETNNLLSSASGITGDLLTKLKSLSTTIDRIKNNLVGQAVDHLNSKLASAGGTVSALLSSLGTTVNPSQLNVSGNVAVGTQGLGNSIASTVNGLLSNLGVKANLSIGH